MPTQSWKHYEDWRLPDPHGLSLDEVRRLRDEIQQRVRKLLTDLGITPAS